MSATAIERTPVMSHSDDRACDMKLEVVTIAVTDIERAKTFYERLGWRLDTDFRQGHERAIQFTPSGSPCSVQFGTGMTCAAPGSAQNLFLVVADIQTARDDLARRGVKVSEVFHYTSSPARFGSRVGGLAPGRLSYRSYASFRDPDGNGWLLQEVTTRVPGRVEPTAARFGSVEDLVSALRRAEAAHGQHEKRIGRPDMEGWSDWYAAYIAAEQAGTALPL